LWHHFIAIADGEIKILRCRNGHVVAISAYLRQGSVENHKECVCVYIYIYICVYIYISNTCQLKKTNNIDSNVYLKWYYYSVFELKRFDTKLPCTLKYHTSVLGDNSPDIRLNNPSHLDKHFFLSSLNHIKQSEVFEQ